MSERFGFTGKNDDGSSTERKTYTVPGISDEELAALAAESTTFEETEVQTAQRHMRQSLLGAVQSMTNLALYSQNERVRLNASQYIIERNMGRVQDNPPAATDDPFAALLADCVAEIENPQVKVVDAAVKLDPNSDEIFDMVNELEDGEQ